MKYFIFLFFLFFICCHTNKIDSKGLEGFWIPESIDWKDASFKILYIKDTLFFQVASTQAKDEKDSLYFMVEPGFNLAGGKISSIGNYSVVGIQDLYKDIPLLSDKFPGPIKLDTLFIDARNPNLLRYQHIEYKRTEMLKQKSKNEINVILKRFSPHS